MSQERVSAGHEPVHVGGVLGNVDDPRWQVRLESAAVDTLVLDQWDAQRSRLRRRTRDGLEIALSLDRGIQLRDGDILVYDEDVPAAVVARIDLKEVMAIELGALRDGLPEMVIRTCVELGHAIGNQHWPAVVKGTVVYVPLTVDKAVMRSVMRTHAFEGIEYDFRPGAEVIPYLAPHEARRLFGAASREGEGHTHVPGT